METVRGGTFVQNRAKLASRSSQIRRLLAGVLALLSLSLPACDKHQTHAHAETVKQKIVVTCPKVRDVVVTQQFVCQIRSQRHIEVCALQSGYLEKIAIKEGQVVKEGDLLFKVIPTLYEARAAAESAEAQLALLECNNTKKLQELKVVSAQELALYEAKLAKAQAKADLAQAELKFTRVVAPYEGIINRLLKQQGSLVKEGDMLTTLSDNRVMWVYFNVPEARHIEDSTSTLNQDKVSAEIELVLANGSKFKYPGKLSFQSPEFNNETGNTKYRADFPNPEGLLRNGMTGNVLLHRTVSNAIVIPQRATFEILEKRYVFVVDKDDVVHQREIKVLHEMDDIYLIDKGLVAGEVFVYEGIRQVRDGQKVEHDYRAPERILGNQQLHSE